MREIVDFIVGCMATSDGPDTVQRVQTEHRLKLAQFWAIKEGSRVLEIGCGQGDTTAVLAYLVGRQGLVHGVDSASPNYGAPITIGDSAKVLLQSELGKQIKIAFEVDVLSPEVDYPEGYFDVIVLSHCSWYLKSQEVLEDLLQRVRKWGKQLAFAEWDLSIQTMDQFPHLLAVLIQAQYESFKDESSSNIRTLSTPNDVRRIAQNAGWTITREESLQSSHLQDGKWELQKILTDYQAELDNLGNMPNKLKSLIHSEVNLLKESTINKHVQTMHTYAFTAE